MSLPGFGKAKMTAGANYENWSLKDGEEKVVCIFPSMHSLAVRGEWSRYWGLHWGWNGVSERKPEKGFNRPFLCIEESKFINGQPKVLKACPVCELIKSRKDRSELIESQGKADKLTPNQIKELLAAEGFPQWLKDHSLSRKHRIVCMDQSQKVGIFHITHTCMKTLKSKIAALVADGMDPLMDVANMATLFRFSRTGQFPPTDSVEAYTKLETVNGKKMPVIQEMMITEEIANHVLETVPDLAELQEYFRYTDEQVAQIAECSGDFEEVDAILGPRRQMPVSPSAGKSVAVKATPERSKPTKTTPKVEPEEEPEALDEAPEEDEEAAAERALAEIKAKRAAKASKAIKVTSARAPAAKPQPKEKVVEDDLDFNELMGE